jgi:hypothetical protein
MKRLLVVLFLVATMSSAAADAYPVNVHVSAVHWRMSADVPTLFLDATVDGKKCELGGPALVRVNIELATLLKPGDYKARVAREEHKTDYQTQLVYEFRFADGKTAKFAVVGLYE